MASRWRRTWRPKLWELNQKFDVDNLPVDLVLTTQGLSPGFSHFFIEAVKQHRDAIGVLNNTVHRLIDQYDADPALTELRQVWQRNRDTDPNTTVWWTPLDRCQLDGSPPSAGSLTCAEAQASSNDLTAELANGSPWVMHVLRAKMSEYVCLVAHAHMFHMYTGWLQVEQTIEPAIRLFVSLMEHLQNLAEQGEKNKLELAPLMDLA